MRLDDNNFPHAGMSNLVFETVDGQIHNGRYDFNQTGARRWIDNNGNEFTSDLVINWYIG